MRRRAGLAGLAAAAVALGAAGAPALGATRTVTRDGVTATLTYGGSAARTPGPIALTLTRAGATQTFSGLESDPLAGTGPVHAQAPSPTYEAFTPTPLRLRDLDGDGSPEALVRLYSGGAHCCEVLSVAWFDATAATWKIGAHAFDDAGWALRNLGGTPSPELVSWDARWAYWGGVYAGSPEPLQVWSFSGGTFRDATRDFPDALRRDQARQLRFSAQAKRQGGIYTGGLAAYVADGWSLGRPAAAVARIRPLLPVRGRARFLKALRNNLVRLGYTKPIAPSGGTAGGY